jgi:hypothetical protein
MDERWRHLLPQTIDPLRTICADSWIGDVHVDGLVYEGVYQGLKVCVERLTEHQGMGRLTLVGLEDGVIYFGLRWYLTSQPTFTITDWRASSTHRAAVHDVLLTLEPAYGRGILRGMRDKYITYGDFDDGTQDNIILTTRVLYALNLPTDSNTAIV